MTLALWAALLFLLPEASTAEAKKFSSSWENVQGKSWEEMQTRMTRAIEKTSGMNVVLNDILGEGENSWDSDPRYPTDTVNCIVWLQLLLAEVYGDTEAEKKAAMDKIRYFSGRPAFALRKHYTDHWMAIEPAPLARVPLDTCAPNKRFRVFQEADKFKRFVKFECPLYHEEWSRIDVNFVDQAGLNSCTRALAAGYYVMFAVPADKYMTKYLHETGPMGLVHAIVLKISVEGDKSPPHVFHASTAKGKVMNEPLSEYLEKNKTIHQGYVLYELMPGWSPKTETPETPEIAKLLECEAKLPRNAHH